jgi:hypothetical protein
MAKYLALIAGLTREVIGLVTSAGATDANKIVETGSTGRLDTSLMPTGIGADTEQMPASEALAAGDLVHVWPNAGVSNARKADASATGKRARGYVLSAVASGATATVFFEGRNDQLSGLTPASDLYLSPTTPGRTVATVPTGVGQVVQGIGVAINATTMNFEPAEPIVLA